MNFSLADIAEGVRLCPDRQIAELKRANSVRNGNTDTELDFIYQMIETIKERVFDDVIQNVHVLIFWNNEMREILGFNFKFKSTIFKMG